MQVHVLAPTVIVVYGVWKLLLTYIQHRNSPLNDVPGPWYTKWTTSVLRYKWMSGQRAEYVQALHEKYGPVVRLSPNEVDFSSVSGAKRIHAFKQPFPKGSMYNSLRNFNGATNVFNTRSLDDHARHRRLLSTAMSETNLKQFHNLIYDRADLVVEKLGLDMKKNGATDVFKWWLFYSTDVIGELTFGDSFRMLEQGKMNQYTYDLQQTGARVANRVAFPGMITLASRIPLPVFSAAADAVKRMHSYAEESIRRYERIIAAEPNKPNPTLFTKVFNASDEIMTQAEIVTNAQAYIVAGSDTTANTLTYLVWAICRNKALQERLVREVQGLPDSFQDEDIRALPFLNQVIKETLRCYASAPAYLPRVVPSDGCDIDGYWMPGGTEVQTQAYSMHRNHAVFPNPNQFNPSRWESPSKEMKDAWMPFGGGPRICIGLHLAQIEIRAAAAKFFRAFPNAKVSALDGFSDNEMEQVIYFLMYPKGKRCLIQMS
ncbi:cytochrome protein [Dendryphion nanum]|uniref:Cytochrome protein n=1 Tax=Dendryphion nanum TaxID=256645 RepID=A0A9P9EHW3_9PLEO|nr:cytochrome protein [Dendryphion nanum]